MSNFVVPVSGSTYMIQNGGLANIVPHVLDNSERVTTDGNPTLSWSVDVPKQNNQIVRRIQFPRLYNINSRFLQWTYLTYPSSTNATVFTLQSVETVDSEPSFGGRGGYVRVDPTVDYLRSRLFSRSRIRLQTNRLVQGGAPFAWQLVPVSGTTTTFK